MPYRFINMNEAAEYLHLRPGELEGLVKSGDIPFETRGDRTVFRRHDLDDWASRRILGADAPGAAQKASLAWQRHCALSSSDLLLPDLIQPDQIDAALKSKTKAAVVRDMVALADRTGWLCDPADLIASLEAREELCSTAVPGGVAFLHPRTSEPYRFTASFIFLARTVQPINYGAPDGQPTDLFFLLCCQDERLHLHTLARLCLMAQKADLLTQLRAAADALAMHTCLLAVEQAVLLNKRRAIEMP